MVRSKRQLEGKSSIKTRYYISGLEHKAKLALRVARAHLRIENELHWVLHIAFREDESRVRKDHAPEYFVILV